MVSLKDFPRLFNWRPKPTVILQQQLYIYIFFKKKHFLSLRHLRFFPWIFSYEIPPLKSLKRDSHPWKISGVAQRWATTYLWWFWTRAWSRLICGGQTRRTGWAQETQQTQEDASWAKERTWWSWRTQQQSPWHPDKYTSKRGTLVFHNWADYLVVAKPTESQKWNLYNVSARTEGWDAVLTDKTWLQTKSQLSKWGGKVWQLNNVVKTQICAWSRLWTCSKIILGTSVSKSNLVVYE